MLSRSWPDRQTFWRNKRVIVTGGACFLGSFVVKKLQQRGAAEIIVPRREHIAELDLPESLLLEEEEELERMLAEKEAGSGYKAERASAILDEEDDLTAADDDEDFVVGHDEPEVAAAE